jgi:uncharacterized protein YeaO (DUF488 family)
MGGVFREAYRKQLQSKRELLEHIRKKEQTRGVILVYAAKNNLYNHALVIKEATENLDK